MQEVVLVVVTVVVNLVQLAQPWCIPYGSKLCMLHASSGVMKSAFFSVGRQTSLQKRPVLIKTPRKESGVPTTVMSIGIMKIPDHYCTKQLDAAIDAPHRTAPTDHSALPILTPTHSLKTRWCQKRQ